ncbi:MAG: hypothetical protein ACLFR7_01275 [Opitutales bacterium]
MHLQSRRGSALVATVLLAIMLASICGAYLETVRQELIQTHRSRMLLEAVNVAEIGAEDALYALTSGDWSGWTAGSEGYSRRTELPFSHQGEERYTETFVRTSVLDRPVIVAEGWIKHPMGFEVRRQVRIDLSTGGVFMNGLTARDQVRMNGNKINVDSYDSAAGPYNPISNRRDNGSVASVNVLVDAVDLNNADVFGFVATGGAPPSVGKNGSIMGFSTPSGTKIDPTRVATDFYAEFPAVEVPALSAPETSVSGSTLNKAEYHLSSLKVAGKDTLNIEGDVVMVIEGDLTVKGKININFASSLTLYISGDIDVGGNGIVNLAPDSKPRDVVIYGTAPDDGSQRIKLSGNGAMQAAIYAPFADVEMKGSGSSGTLMGAVVANHILLTGNFEFHYDEDLRNFASDDRFEMESWRELTEAGSQYANVSALRNGGL